MKIKSIYVDVLNNGYILEVTKTNSPDVDAPFDPTERYVFIKPIQVVRAVKTLLTQEGE